ncbi:Serine--tRNA ligase [Capsicum baccatum]|uniref:Serine--tRNA ligase n=1 Tax=Capsicum baccatum TaxID=33114 RepID=A0A2G2V9L3_CAPBA|nr:Serine--tRNA ligase [Capsicum baccatum]
MEAYERNFLWGDTETRTKMHLLSWKEVTKPKEIGGLGIHRLAHKNLALLASSDWHVFYSEAPWAQVLRFKYLGRKGASSKIWKTLTIGWAQGQLGLQWKPSNGKFKLENLQRDLNKINKTKPVEDAIKRNIAEKNKIIKKKKADVKEIKANLDSKLETIGNLVHDSVPFSDDEANNVMVRSWGEKRTEKGLKNYVDLINALSIADLTKGGGYTLLQTPFFMRKDIMAKCAQLAQFNEELYKVTGEGEDKYLIATAEQPFCAYQLEEHISPSRLSLRYAGFSPCFCKKAGSHGRNTLGIFRVHQFDKVEQFCLTNPNGNDSWDMHEEIVRKRKIKF